MNTPMKQHPAAQSANAARYIEWASCHWFWKSRIRELNDLLDKQIEERNKVSEKTHE